jgi:predicted ATPase/class 3 adenylate cyclase
MTDIEGSTRLWEEHREAMGAALATHDAIVRDAVEDAGGSVVKMTGDGVLAVFERPEAAVDAAVGAQRALAAATWPATGPLRARMAIHAGVAETRDGDVHGQSLNRVARLLAIGHGGQVLLSAAGAALLADDLPDGVALEDRGEHHLRDLGRPEPVFQLVAPGLPRDFPALRSENPPTNLPPELTSFVGRERELDAIDGLLAKHRLVTLVGVGGTGKTRLMLRAGERRANRHRHGAWLVELAAISEPGLVVTEVARALGASDAPGRPAIDVVTDYLRSKELLLLLDNCEHLIEPAADLVRRLLGTCRSLQVVATSREALGIEGEAILQVPSLGVPEAPAHLGDQGPPEPVGLADAAAADAVRLFVDRAGAIAPGFVLDETTVGPVVEICRRLDGIPLAIELAAARVNVLSVAEIARRLGDRFRLLTGGRRTSVPRQQTLQALIDWSWDLLAEPDRRLLRRLAVFAGGWTLDDAAEVTRDPDDDPADAQLAALDGLGRLADRSLIVVEHQEPTRYRMLETIRQYARDRLIAAGETEAVRNRHLEVFARLAVDAQPRLDGPELVAQLEQMDPEVDNLRAALDWAHEVDVEAGLRMTVAMGQYWRNRSTGTEIHERTEQAIAALPRLPEPADDERRARESLLARLYGTAAMSSGVTGRTRDQAARWLAEGTRHAEASGDREAIALVLTGRALLTVFGGLQIDGDPMATMASLVALLEEVGQWSQAAFALAGLAMYQVQRDPAAALAALEQATAAATRSGNPSAIAFTALSRGRVLGFRGDLGAARPWFDEAIEGFHRIGDARLELSARSDLAHALRTAGHLEQAEAAYRDVILGWQHLGQRGAIARLLECFGFLAVGRGEPRRAAVLLGAAERTRRDAETDMIPFERAEYDACLADLRARLDPAELGRAWAEGGGLSVDNAIAFARGS